MKNHGTFHGAVKNGQGQAPLGAIGHGKGSGTKMGINTMGTGRVVSVGKMTPVTSGRKLSRKGLTGMKGAC